MALRPLAPCSLGAGRPPRLPLAACPLVLPAGCSALAFRPFRPWPLGAPAPPPLSSAAPLPSARCSDVRPCRAPSAATAPLSAASARLAALLLPPRSVAAGRRRLPASDVTPAFVLLPIHAHFKRCRLPAARRSFYCGSSWARHAVSACAYRRLPSGGPGFLPWSSRSGRLAVPPSCFFASLARSPCVACASLPSAFRRALAPFLPAVLRAAALHAVPTCRPRGPSWSLPASPIPCRCRLKCCLSY